MVYHSGIMTKTLLMMMTSESINPAYNLALEEVLCSSDHELFMLWQNEPSVILGRFNDINQCVNMDICREQNIHIIRRNSGGGAVYHDLGNINYSFVLNDDRAYTLAYFAEVFMKLLRNIGINGELTFTHNDILLDGAKISGTAQYHHNGRILHHGTLLFESDLDMIPRVLRRSGKVTNIRPRLKRYVNIHDFMIALCENLCVNEFMSLSQAQVQSVNELMQRKYMNPIWNMKGMNIS